MIKEICAKAPGNNQDKNIIRIEDIKQKVLSTDTNVIIKMPQGMYRKANNLSLLH